MNNLSSSMSHHNMKVKTDNRIELPSFFAVLLLSIIGLTNLQCTENRNTQIKLKAGDLLFQDLNCGPLCDAIEAVTEGENGRDFSHCAMVISINDSLKVIEAIGQQVQINSLEERLFDNRGGSEREDF